MASWTCDKCKRKFSKVKQSHSCKVYPISNHFRGKDYGKGLYDELIAHIKAIGKFRIDSVECCIHLVNETTFSGIFIMKDKIRVSFSLDHKIDSKRIYKSMKISANRYNYQVNVKSKEEIDEELMKWIREGYELSG